MIISSASYRRLVDRAPATIQAGRARYASAQQAVSANTPGVPAQTFSEQAGKAFDGSSQTGMLTLDLSPELGTGYPATTGNLLARYLVLREGEEHEFSPRASSVLCFAMTGSGRAFREDEVIEWASGDVFLFPGGETLLFESPDADSVVFVVTDEPMLTSLGCTAPGEEDVQVQSTHFTAKTITAQFEDIQAKMPDAEPISRLELGSTPFEQSGCVAPGMAAGVALLEPGRNQPDHCHDADTISLCRQCDGVYSMIAGNRTEWVANAAILTPAGAVHSQHNTGEERVFSFYVQDRGPRVVRTWEPRSEGAQPEDTQAENSNAEA